jgi:phosphoribosylamine--glycine ligase
MKILLIGNGGREHAHAWKFLQEDPATTLIAAPGNAGIAEVARCVAILPTDLDAIVALAEAERPDVTVIGPEAPLAMGLVDRLRERGLPAFGPTGAAARIESSKAFAKSLMVDAGVPTARATRHTDAGAAKRAARDLGAPVVIKASGLAAGKGVVVAQTIAEADTAIDAMLTHGAFGAAGSEILVEEFMDGQELSLLFVTDGTRWMSLTPAQDHKRLLDGDRGPNTGGMGAYAPASPSLPGSASDATALESPWTPLVHTAAHEIVEPMLGALRDRGAPFTGVLYAGLMVTADGLKVVEFNCRMGDPETQAILPLTGLALAPVMQRIAAGGELDQHGLSDTRAGHAVATVVAAAGYPERARTGDVIHLPPSKSDVLVFHAGTARTPGGELVTAGGRVLAVTAVAPTLADAQRASVEYAAQVEFPGKRFRTDIAWRELARHARAS